MLKAYLCFFLVLLGHLGLSAQAVKILFAPANMRSAESGKILVADDNLLAEEKITMPNYDASLIVWDELDGLCELKARQVSGKKWKISGTVGELNQPITALTLPYVNDKFGNLSDLKTHFEGRNFLILGKSWLIAQENGFRVNGDTVIFVHYRDAYDHLQVSRKLEFASDTLLLYPELILDNNGAQVKAENTSNFELLAIDRNSHDLQPICSFNLQLPNNEQLAKEVGLLLDKLAAKNMPAEEMKIWIYTFLKAAYGEADRHNFEEWLLQNFQLTFSAKN